MKLRSSHLLLFQACPPRTWRPGSRLRSCCSAAERGFAEAAADPQRYSAAQPVSPCAWSGRGARSCDPAGPARKCQGRRFVWLSGRSSREQRRHWVHRSGTPSRTTSACGPGCPQITQRICIALILSTGAGRVVASPLRGAQWAPDSTTPGRSQALRRRPVDCHRGPWRSNHHEQCPTLVAA